MKCSSRLEWAGGVKGHGGGPVACHAAHALWNRWAVVIIILVAVIFWYWQPVAIPAVCAAVHQETRAASFPAAGSSCYCRRASKICSNAIALQSLWKIASTVMSVKHACTDQCCRHTRLLCMWLCESEHVWCHDHEHSPVVLEL